MFKWWSCSSVPSKAIHKRRVCPAYFTRRKLHLPMELVEYLCQYMDTNTLSNFVKASWPNGEESENLIR
ncbi:rlp [Trichoplusia ni granulovirus LBIV-12]|jgi:hypothetical protein|uniref:Rlp n=2 Tax=Betabaculovirus TaxID=558017 RepID=A0A1D8QL87_GVTN|nr:Rep-like protein [Pseudalatia unipuncta granulovirus]YP_009506142.1 rlp [Trichoplusia ni granulovirus LBIV-12]ACH69431.1 Rep-like protein [Pseudalatia unipuncta granulovirus]AOW41411.1 rlp [Trichoplusia ni granulovirus LBIV-12]